MITVSHTHTKSIYVGNTKQVASHNGALYLLSLDPSISGNKADLIGTTSVSTKCHTQRSAIEFSCLF